MTHLKIFIFFFFFLISSLTHAAFYDPHAEMKTVKTPHFYIHYPKEVTPVATDFIEISEKVFKTLTVKLNWVPKSRTHVVLMDKTDEPNGLATVIPANYVLLYITPPSSDSSLDNYKEYLTLLFTHEFTHILHIDQYHKYATPFRWVFGKIIAPNGLTPGWMREGMAAWEESIETGYGRGNSSYSDMVLRAAIYDNRFPKIDQAAGLAPTWPGADSQYIFGVKFWQWISKKYGEDSIARYMKKYSSGLWLFSLNNKAKNVFGKSFYKLWKEWQTELQSQYAAVKTKLTAEGLTTLKPFITSKNQIFYPTPRPNSTGYAYVEGSLDESPRIVIIREKGQKPLRIKRTANGQLSFSNDGKNLAFSSISTIKPFTSYSEVFVYNLNTQKTVRLAPKMQKGENPQALRASDPDFSPLSGGSRYVVMVRTDLGTDNLYVFDRNKKTGHFLTKEKKYTQFSNPRYSPDGQNIVVSRRESNGNRDIILYDLKGNELKKITDDEAIDNHPFFSPDGQFIYFDSNATGINNIYRYSLEGKTIDKVTNVLTGLSQPHIGIGNSGQIFASYYSSTGTNSVTFNTPAIISTQTHPAEQTTVATEQYENILNDLPHSLEKTTLTPIPNSKKYNAFPQVLVPKYLIPTFATLDSSFLVGFATGRSDPLYRHNWSLFTNYRSDANFLGGGLTYSYQRYVPVLFAGVSRYALNWGDIFNTGHNFFEDRLQGYGGVALSHKYHTFQTTYFYESRNNLSSIPVSVTNALLKSNLNSYAGFHFKYIYSHFSKFPYSISQEQGPYVQMGFDITNSLLGAAESNEQEIATADLRYYLEMPWSNHHVLALRTAGGWAFGDQQFSGTFRFGGPFGEGNMAGYSDRLFPLRGLPGITFAGDRVLMASAEYRLPLARVERGIGTWPIFLNDVNLVFFDDYGDSWYRNGKDHGAFFDNFFMGVGAELRGDFTIGYGLPITTRFGYAYLLLNSEQVAGLKDPLTGSSIKNGTFYFQLGTSF